jgi:uncharacterized protein YjbJ (UPF0337 family)
METTRTQGAVREAAGNVQEAIGEVVGDVSAQLAGKTQALRGKAQQLCADATAVTHEALLEKPLATLTTVAAVAFALGVLWSRNRTDTTNGDRTRRR